MKSKLYIGLIILLFSSNAISQTIKLHSITTLRQNSGDVGYTLDGVHMEGARVKLLSSGNFGTNGTYSKSVSIFDGYETTGSLTDITTIPTDNILLFGAFNKSDSSTQQFSTTEIDSLYNWSKRGGKLIITAGPTWDYWNYTNLT